MSVSDILLARARLAGEARQRSGAIWGQTIQGLGQIPAQLLDQRRQDSILARQQAREDEALGYKREAAGRERSDYERENALAKTEAQKQQILGRANAAAFADDPMVYNLDKAAAQLTADGHPEFLPIVHKVYQDNLPKLTSGAPGSVMRDQNGQVVAGSAIPEKPVAPTAASLALAAASGDPQARAAHDLLNQPKAPEAGSFPDYLRVFAQELGKTIPELKKADIEAARKAYQQADDRPRVNVSLGVGGLGDVKESIAGMRDGTIPPQLPGRASKDYTAMMAEAHRQGYNLQGAVTDWNATQKHVATMNGAQQLRLNQAINALPDMLDKVDTLASSWKGGKFPILNKANLALAKGGAYGQDVASVANQLDAQIADVVADLGNVYMGGNSPTDHALGLAGKSLNGEWSEKVLRDMVKLAKQNVTIRQNSIKNTGVAGASDTNPYGRVPTADVPVPPAGPAEGAVKPIAGHPGTEQTFRNGKWIRTK